MVIINNKKIMIFLKWLLVIVFLAFVIFNFSFHKKTLDSYNHQIKINDQILNVEYALNQIQQEKGLSDRVNLQENQGMLFVFEKPGNYFFWMKDMNFAIDMIWFDENQKIIYIQKNALPESYPASFGPKEDSKYVLEVVSEFSNKYNLKIGDKFEILN
ncbi:DUF192 domain-containing protein [Candidatus Nomurabacteria bacterium]|nr:DUF192 domain-containing protein [Candidatus Nomurabacteria bacterium]